MDELLSKLADLENSQDWHHDAREQFKVWREEIKRLELDKEFLELPKVKKMGQTLTAMVDNINAQLCQNEILNEIERARLFATKEVATAMKQVFCQDYYKQVAKIINDDIDAEFNKTSI